MKTAILQDKYPVYAKLLYWSKLITITGGAQAVVQGTGLLAGVLVIRLLSTEEYAYYTLANTVLGMMTMLSDGGISNGVLAQGGKVWQDKGQLGAVLATGLALRRTFAVAALMIGGAVLAFLLLRNGAGWFTTVLIVLALLPSFLAALSDSLLEIVPKLHQQVSPLQKNQVLVGVGRLFFTGIFLVIFPFTWITVLISGLVRAYGNIKLRDIAYASAEKQAAPDPLIRTEILYAVKRVLPITLYYCLSSQIIIWIPSLMGNTTGVAQVGALSRLAMLLSFVSTMVSTLVLPRFARLPTNDRTGIISSFLFIQLSLFGMSAIVLTIFFLFPHQLLWILGKSYANLSYELLLLIAANCIGTTASITGNIIGSRGWYVNPYSIIGINVFSLVLSLFLFNLSETVGVLYYNILLGGVTYLFTIGYSLFCLSTRTYEQD